MTFLVKFNTGFGKRLKQSIETAGFTQREFAKKMSVHEVTVSKWVQETRYPDLFTGYKIAEYLEVSLDWLINGKKYDVNLSVFQVGEPSAEYGFKNNRDQKDFFFSEDEVDQLLDFMELDAETRKMVLDLIEKVENKKREGK